MDYFVFKRKRINEVKYVEVCLSLIVGFGSVNSDSIEKNIDFNL